MYGRIAASIANTISIARCVANVVAITTTNNNDTSQLASEPSCMRQYHVLHDGLLGFGARHTLLADTS